MPGQRHAETSIYLVSDRNLPREMLAAQARAMADSGVVDHIMVADQLTSFIPSELWTPENVPAAAQMPDPDSFGDGWAVGAYAAAIAPEVKLTLMTDVVRHGPTEMIQRMMTLANLTEGNAFFQIGSGEIKQTKAFGWKRKEGLDKLEDLVKLFDQVWDADGPIDFEGHHVTWKRGSLGAARPHRPILWGLGAGPRLVDLATTYLDGLCVFVPGVWATPEIAEEEIRKIRETVEAKGRDPEAFKIGVGGDTLMHADEGLLEEGMNNPVIKWMTAALGRINQPEWERDGLPMVLPENWKYYLHLTPHDMPEGIVDEALSKVTMEHVKKGWIWGGPGKVASDYQDYIDAGVDWISIGDFLPLVLPPEEAATAMVRAIEVCARLKGKVPEPAAAGG